MLPCVIFSFEALSEKHLRMHMQNEHDDSVITCEKCNKSCKGGRKFKTHMNSHREVNCKHCGKKIPYNSTTSHVTRSVLVRSHSNVKIALLSLTQRVVDICYI